MHLYPIDGAVHDVASSDSAFAYRDAGWAEVIVGVDPDPANADDAPAVDGRLLRRDRTPTRPAAPTSTS